MNFKVWFESDVIVMFWTNNCSIRLSRSLSSSPSTSSYTTTFSKSLFASWIDLMSDAKLPFINGFFSVASNAYVPFSPIALLLVSCVELWIVPSASITKLSPSGRTSPTISVVAILTFDTPLAVSAYVFAFAAYPCAKSTLDAELSLLSLEAFAAFSAFADSTLMSAR